MDIIENGLVAEFLRQTLHMIGELASHGGRFLSVVCTVWAARMGAAPHLGCICPRPRAFSSTQNRPTACPLGRFPIFVPQKREEKETPECEQ